MKQIYLILLVLLFPFKIFSQTEKEKDIAPSPEATQTTMIKDSLDVPLVSPIPQTGYIPVSYTHLTLPTKLEV